LSTQGRYLFLRNTIGQPKTVASGANPVTGDIASKVIVDSVVSTYNGYPYVQRHYDIEPDQNASTATATVSLYFTQGDFDNYNLYPGHGLDFPSGPLDTSKRTNIRIYQYHGFSASSLPGTYPGTGVEIDPADSNIAWNAAADCWEVKFDVTGFSGFFLSGKGNALIPVTFKTIANGDWNDPQIWEGKILPSATSDVIVATYVIINTNVTCNSIKIVYPGNLTVATGVNLKVLH
jgi:hypothetical protein